MQASKASLTAEGFGVSFHQALLLPSSSACQAKTPEVSLPKTTNHCSVLNSQELWDLNRITLKLALGFITQQNARSRSRKTSQECQAGGMVLFIRQCSLNIDWWRLNQLDKQEFCIVFQRQPCEAQQGNKHRDRINKGSHHIFTRAEDTRFIFSPTLFFFFGEPKPAQVHRNFQKSKGESSNTVVYLKQSQKENLLWFRKKKDEFLTQEVKPTSISLLVLTSPVAFSKDKSHKSNKNTL